MSYVPPWHAQLFWRYTPDWVQNLIDRASRLWRTIDTDIRMELDLPIQWSCRRPFLCWCDLSLTKHTGEVHARCRHCTNPAVACGRCGARHLSERDPRKTERPWTYYGLIKGWRCNQCRS